MSKPSKSVVFVRRGDFYEHSGPQAAALAKILGLTVTQGRDGLPCIGCPKHALHYLDVLVSSGYAVILSA